MMSSRWTPALRSYLKTTLTCLGLSIMAAVAPLLAALWLPKAIALVVYAASLFLVFAAGLFSVAGVVVLIRHGRDVRGARDLFLELNRSREPDAIKEALPVSNNRVRRWLARLALGHDFVVGDFVEVKSWPEIRATLDERGCVDQLPFMPEMLAACGQRLRVFRCVHRIFDYRKTRRMRHMDSAVLLVGTTCSGLDHGGCEAACHTIWRPVWLRRPGHGQKTSAVTAPSDSTLASNDTAVLRFGTMPPRYACQLTQLNAASQPLGGWSMINFLRPLISGNVALAAFIVGWLTYAFNELQHWRGGIGFPTFHAVPQGLTAPEEARLQPGDRVLVRSSAEIRSTLNDRLIHRGLGFEPDMLKYCGHRCSVQSEVRRLLDIVSGDLRAMKTPAYLLRDVHFSGERQLFNAQYEPLFWRSVWLKKE